MREPCISVGFTGTPGDGAHIKPSSIYTFDWLPKGYGPSMEDRTICVLFDSEDRMESRLGVGERHPLVEAIARAIETHLKNNPADAVGFLHHHPSKT